MPDSSTTMSATNTRPDFWNNPRPTNENPNFVHDYFASSRLHFIGSFRARYESMMVSVGQKLGINPSILLENNNHTKNIKDHHLRHTRIIVHVDMDAFFASVAVRDNPQLQGLPVAVCHDAGEISSCTYEARKHGVRAGMFLRDARKLCPSLKTVAYDFEAYERVCIQIYTLFFQLPRTCVEAVSVDEAYLDVTYACPSSSKLNPSSNNGVINSLNDNLNLCDNRESDNKNTNDLDGVDNIVRTLRKKIYDLTGCTASAGIGPSKLVARLATKAAKPNGQFRVLPDNVMSYFDSLSVRDLPGIGWRTAQRLQADDLRVTTVPQLRSISLSRLQSLFGDRQGTVFYDLARAVDSREVQPLKPRRSIGAELSWGVRFLSSEGEKVMTFIAQVASEVALRVSAAGAYGTRVIYKVYKRVRNADASHYKHLGHGPCSIVTRSTKLPSRASGTALKKSLVLACQNLHKEIDVLHDDFRGIGIQVADLTFADLKFERVPSVPGTSRIDSFFKRSTTRNEVRVDERDGIETINSHGLEDSRDTEHQPKDHLENDENDASIEIAPASVGELANHTENYDGEVLDTASNDNVEHAPIGTDCLDEIQPVVVPARDDERANNVNNGEINHANSNNNSNDDVTLNGTDIPEGWDRNIFENLPADIKAELLQDAERNKQHQHHQPLQQTLRHMLGIRQHADGNHHNNNIVQFEHDRDRDPDAKRQGKRRKRGGQMTMTQLAEVERARRRGTGMVDAAEFRGRRLRDAVELLEDLKGPKYPLGGGQENWSRDGVDVMATPDIPSPPSLSSDDDDDDDVDSASDDDRRSLDDIVHTRITGRGDIDRVYAAESVSDYAVELAEWMQLTGNDVRSAHIELVRGRLLEMLRQRNLNRICEELRMLRHFALRDGAHGWMSAFNILLSQIQEECRNEFHFRLNIEQLKQIDLKNHNQSEDHHLVMKTTAQP